MVKEKKSAKAILEALKIEMAQPHMTASALLVLCPYAEQRKVVLDRSSINLHRQNKLL
jgi:hypothetical protein